MTALIITIFILELILTAWAAGITALYFQLVRTLRKITGTDQEALRLLFGNDKEILHALTAVIKTVETVEQETTAYKAIIDEQIEKSKDTADFAIKTIQEARRIYQQAISNTKTRTPDPETMIQQVKEKIDNEQ